MCIINSLPRESHTGKTRSPYGRRGHIKGSVNLPCHDLIQGNGYRPLAELRESFSAVGALDAEQVITYCTAGISATMDAFGLTLLGHPNVAVYDGSLAEWAKDPDLPMEIGG